MKYGLEGIFQIADGNLNKIVKPDDIMEEGPTLRFDLSYPLSKPFVFDQTHEDGSGWTRRQIIEAVQSSYRHIYQTEESSQSVDPGRASAMLLNRGKSDGTYGIWGHDIDDLVIESIIRDEDGKWNIGIGS